MTIKKTTQRHGFKTSEFVVYPAHGVGQIVSIEEQEVAGAKLELFVISFIKDKMTLRVPTAKIVSVGMRKLAEPPIVKRALETLKGRAVARDRGGAAHHRDRSGQGDRSRARQGPAPRSEAGRGRGRGRGRSGVTAAAFNAKRTRPGGNAGPLL
jgi:hypothetical protein